MPPARYATLVAENRQLAIEFAKLSAQGTTGDAERVVRQAADDILEHCDNMLVITPTGESTSLLLSLQNIETVAKRSDQRGDEVQVRWCILLHEKLAASAGVPPRRRSD
jgi:hypothetical protein